MRSIERIFAIRAISSSIASIVRHFYDTDAYTYSDSPCTRIHIHVLHLYIYAKGRDSLPRCAFRLGEELFENKDGGGRTARCFLFFFPF